MKHRDEIRGSDSLQRLKIEKAAGLESGYVLDKNPNVAAWAKNDHLGFDVLYVFKGVVRKYRPDFLIRLTDGTMLVLEVKGQDSPEDRTKREFLAEWVCAVNEHGGFGRWASDVSTHPKDIEGILNRHAAAAKGGRTPLIRSGVHAKWRPGYLT
jgi:hypothetical protein